MGWGVPLRHLLWFHVCNVSQLVAVPSSPQALVVELAWSAILLAFRHCYNALFHKTFPRNSIVGPGESPAPLSRRSGGKVELDEVDVSFRALLASQCANAALGFPTNSISSQLWVRALFTVDGNLRESPSISPCAVNRRGRLFICFSGSFRQAAANFLNSNLADPPSTRTSCV